MSHRSVLLVGVDQYRVAPDLEGARSDVLDLLDVLLDRGVEPSRIRVLTAPRLDPSEAPRLAADALLEADASTLREGLAWLADQLEDDDCTALVHVSARGATRADCGPAVAMSDGTLVPISELSTAFAHVPVRSVLTVLDVGFAGTGGRTLGADAPVDALPTAGDPVISAHGASGSVREQRLGGQKRGVLAWTLARVLETVDGDASFDQVLRAVRSIQAGLRAGQQPMLSPRTAGERTLGALLDGGRGHVPWRGVEATFQVLATEGIIASGGSNIGTFGCGDQDWWSWTGATTWPTAGFTIDITQMGAGPAPGGAQTFQNNAFGSSTSSTPPSVGSGDRVFQAQFPQISSDYVFLIVRNVSSPTALDWYTTSNESELPVQVNDQLVFTNTNIDNNWWQGLNWHHANCPSV